MDRSDARTQSAPWLGRRCTARQLAVLRLFDKLSRERGFPPSNRDIAAHFGMSASGPVEHLRALEWRGLITPCAGSRTRSVTPAGRALLKREQERARVLHGVRREWRCPDCGAATFATELPCPICARAA